MTQQGARFAKWRGVVSIPAGPSLIALRDCAYGLARYAAIAQVHTHPYWLTRTFILSWKLVFPRMLPDLKEGRQTMHTKALCA